MKGAEGEIDTHQFFFVKGGSILFDMRKKKGRIFYVHPLLLVQYKN